MEEIIEKLDDMSIEKAANALDVLVNYFKKLNKSEQHDYAYDFFNHGLNSDITKAEFMGAPLDVVIPDELVVEFEKIKDDNELTNEFIKEWLSDEFEWNVKDFDKIEWSN